MAICHRHTHGAPGNWSLGALALPSLPPSGTDMPFFGEPMAGGGVVVISERAVASGSGEPPDGRDGRYHAGSGGAARGPWSRMGPIIERAIRQSGGVLAAPRRRPSAALARSDIAVATRGAVRSMARPPIRCWSSSSSLCRPLGCRMEPVAADRGQSTRPYCGSALFFR
jgi:hypothetical protein